MWELKYKESWVLKNWCFWTVVLEKTLESPLDSKEIQPVHPQGNQSWIFIGRTDTEAELQSFGHLMRRTDSFKKTLIWERLRAGGEGDDRVWDDLMASPTQWTRVWVNSGSWWWTGRPGMLQNMRSQRVGHYWGTELNWTEQGQQGGPCASGEGMSRGQGGDKHEHRTTKNSSKIPIAMLLRKVLEEADPWQMSRYLTHHLCVLLKSFFFFFFYIM